MLLKGKRIFYIDDNPQNLVITQLILEQHGAEVGVERWGQEEVFRKLEAFMPIDLILMDLMFSRNVTGYEIFDMIRSQPAYQNIPMVAVSAAEPTVEIPKAREKGFAGYIPKPVSLLHFPVQIFSILQGMPVWVGEED